MCTFMLVIRVNERAMLAHLKGLHTKNRGLRCLGIMRVCLIPFIDQSHRYHSDYLPQKYAIISLGGIPDQTRGIFHFFYDVFACVN
jgi:uncharacterized membrane protein